MAMPILWTFMFWMMWTFKRLAVAVLEAKAKEYAFFQSSISINPWFL